MVSAKSLRRIVAGFAIALYLACQSAAVVYARAGDFQTSGATQGSCHESGQPNSKTTGDSDCHASCQSQSSPPSNPIADVYAVTDLPAITVRFDNIVAVAVFASSAKPPLLRIESPALVILHCCLRY
jgi:hypothetical protein